MRDVGEIGFTDKLKCSNMWDLVGANYQISGWA